MSKESQKAYLEARAFGHSKEEARQIRDAAKPGNSARSSVDEDDDDSYEDDESFDDFDELDPFE
jgi:hypothetical protein